MKKSDLIRKAAEEIGDYHSNKELISFIKNKYGCRVLSSSITNTLGATKYRRTTIPEILRNKARNFIEACRNDKRLIYRLIRMEI